MTQNPAIKRKRKISTNYRSSQTLHLCFPDRFLAIAKLLQVTPSKMLLDFIFSVGCRPTFNNNLIEQRATDYFISQGYGKEFFDREQVRGMLTEIGLIERLMPTVDSSSAEWEEWKKMNKECLNLWKAKWKRIKKERQKKR
jgi:hypothetical protein